MKTYGLFNPENKLIWVGQAKDLNDAWATSTVFANDEEIAGMTGQGFSLCEVTVVKASSTEFTELIRAAVKCGNKWGREIIKSSFAYGPSTKEELDAKAASQIATLRVLERIHKES